MLNANVAVIESEILELQDDFDNPTAGAGARLIAPLYQGGALKTQVSIRTLEQKEAVAQYGSTDSGASLGDILGAALNKVKGDDGEEPAAKPKRKRAAKADDETSATPDE